MKKIEKNLRAEHLVGSLKRGRGANQVPRLPPHKHTTAPLQKLLKPQKHLQCNWLVTEKLREETEIDSMSYKVIFTKIILTYYDMFCTRVNDFKPTFPLCVKKVNVISA